ncbi:YbaB/EbfC family nucleoid-associated protein [Nocardia vaccinii]|uniref:YbaB/EbfC family nucleoid-associated protein n=1 Tax=Nocardia vaccinii TaxID=1822 RepID=UPI000834940C|nr:YbaB/EbfC family nucleoid-associated protein [Nocardia vaccinii]
MSADIPEWERQLKGEVAELRRHSMELTQRIAAVRGRAEVQGIMVEVDGNGDITNLQIAPGAMRWASGQLASALIDCHRKARSEAKAKIELIVRKADPRIRDQTQRLRDSIPDPEPQHRQKTEEEIQADDDAFFERMNRTGWR